VAGRARPGLRLPDAFKQQVCLFHSGIVDGFSLYNVIAQDGQFSIAAATHTEGQGADADRAIRLLAKALFDMRAGWARTQGNNTLQPVVLRASRSRCACAASARA